MNEIDSILKNNFFKTAIDQSINPTVICESKGKILYINNAFLDSCGYSKKSDILGKNFSIFFKTDRNSDSIFNLIIKNNKIFKKITGITKNKKEIELLANGIAMDNPDNNTSLIIFTLFNLPDIENIIQKKILIKNQELETKNQKLQSSDRHLCTINRQLEAKELELIEQNKKLSESKNKYKSYVDNAPDCIFIADNTGAYIEVNNKACKLTGYSKNELLNMTILDLSPKEDLEKTAIEFSELKQNKSLETELKLKCKNGRVINVSLKAVMLNDNRIMGFCSDITEQKQHLEKIKKFSKAIEISYNGIIFTELNGDITFANKSVRQIFGYSKSELLNNFNVKNFLVNPYDNIKILNEIKQNGQHYGEMECIRKNGKIFPIILSNSIITDIEGEPIGTIGIFTDISKQKQKEKELIFLNNELDAVNQQLKANEQQLHAANQQLESNNQQLKANEQQLRAANQQLESNNQQLKANEQQLLAANQQLIAKELALSESEKLYRTLTHNLPGMVYRAKPDWSTEVISNCKEISGYTEKELSEKKINWFDLILEQDRLRVLQENKNLNLKPVSIFQEYRIKTKSGNIIWVKDYKSSLFDSNNKFSGVDGVVFNINEQKQLYEPLVYSEKLSSVGQLASGIAHEFNNILAIQQINSQLLQIKLKELNLTDDTFNSMAKHLSVIIDTIGRGTSIVQNMNSFAQAKPAEKRFYELQGIVKNVIKLQSQQLKLENIIFTEEYNIKNKIFVDKVQIEQVFLNIIINARHAIKPRGKGSIKLSAFEKDDKIIIQLSDSGTGMSKNIIKKIFNPFFSTKGAYSKDDHKIKGTGLGLSVSHTIINNHNGTISVKSIEGQGSTFTITLPVISKVTDNNLIANQKIIKDDSIIDKNIKILLIDDEEEFLFNSAELLAIKGFTNIKTCTDGKTALEIIQNEKLDIIFLDMLMPDMDGINIICRVKKIKPDIPVIFVSGQIELEKEDILKYDAYDFIRKPYDINEILNILKRISATK